MLRLGVVVVAIWPTLAGVVGGAELPAAERPDDQGFSARRLGRVASAKALIPAIAASAIMPGNRHTPLVSGSLVLSVVMMQGPSERLHYRYAMSPLVRQALQ